MDLPSELVAECGAAEAAAAAAGFLPLDGDELEQELPMAVDPPSPAGQQAEAAGTAAEAAAQPAAADGAAAAAASGRGASVVEELSLGAPARARGAEALPPAPSKQESALLPQCAMVTGGALEAAEVSTREAAAGFEAAAPLPPRDPSQQYLAVKAELSRALIRPDQAGVSWDRFPNHLGEGLRSRLLALATLHLGAAPVPAAIKELAANNNRVLLGAATNCELYQERMVRWAGGGGGLGLEWWLGVGVSVGWECGLGVWAASGYLQRLGGWLGCHRATEMPGCTCLLQARR